MTTAFLLYERLRFPSGRTVRKYRSVHGRGPTEKLEHAWCTPDRALAEMMAREMKYEVEERELIDAPAAKFGETPTARFGKIVRR